jgi:hypothetical protein
LRRKKLLGLSTKTDYVSRRNRPEPLDRADERARSDAPECHGREPRNIQPNASAAISQTWDRDAFTGMALTAIDHDADVIGKCERVHDKRQGTSPTFGGKRFCLRHSADVALLTTRC